MHWRKIQYSVERERSMLIRNVMESDRDAVAVLIVETFSSLFSRLDKNLALIAQSIRNSLVLNHFFVAEEGKVIGVIAVSSRESHAFRIDKKAFIRSLGFVKGRIAAYFFKQEMRPKAALTDSAAYIEIVAVDKHARGRGVASEMIRHLTFQACYTEYYLEVLDTNEAAIRCYQKLGFVEVSREKEHFTAGKNFRYRIIMKLSL
jgi:ribosomal protein S18 acetylase RimI-like enzyme